MYLTLLFFSFSLQLICTSEFFNNYWKTEIARAAWASVTHKSKLIPNWTRKTVWLLTNGRSYCSYLFSLEKCKLPEINNISSKVFLLSIYSPKKYIYMLGISKLGKYTLCNLFINKFAFCFTLLSAWRPWNYFVCFCTLLFSRKISHFSPCCPTISLKNGPLKILSFLQHFYTFCVEELWCGYRVLSSVYGSFKFIR